MPGVDGKNRGLGVASGETRVLIGLRHRAADAMRPVPGGERAVPLRRSGKMGVLSALGMVRGDEKVGDRGENSGTKWRVVTGNNASRRDEPPSFPLTLCGANLPRAWAQGVKRLLRLPS